MDNHLKSLYVHSDSVHKKIEELDRKWQIELNQLNIELNLLILSNYKFEKTIVLYLLPLLALIIAIIENDVVTIINSSIVIVIIALVVMAYRRSQLRKTYEKAKINYEKQRSQLLNQLNQ